MIKLIHRLKAIADVIHQANCVIDVGTDHALLPIYLIQAQKAKFVYAVDNKIGPIMSAQLNIKKYNLESQIKIIKNSGLPLITKLID